MDSLQEVWRSVPSFPFYEASSLGRIRSIDRMVNGKGTSKVFRRGIVLKQIPHKGYLAVSVGKNGQSIDVHQLVAETFLEKQDGLVVNHKDGVKTNNVPENLEYITSNENVKHAHRTGLLVTGGGKHGQAALTDDQAREILASPHVSSRTFAERFGCRMYVIQRVRSRQTYRNV